MRIVTSQHRQQYLEAHGIYPVEEHEGASYYYNTPELSKLLDRYYIEYYCIPNKNK